MYQFSLKYFSAVFCSVIAAPHDPLPLQQRLVQLMNDEIYAIYLNVSRGLFEKHKLIFSFLLAVAVEKQENRITATELDFLLRGPVGTRAKITDKPNSLLISEYAWKCCLHLQKEYNEFKNICEDLNKLIHIEMSELNEVFFVLYTIFSITFSIIIMISGFLFCGYQAKTIGKKLELLEIIS